MASYSEKPSEVYAHLKKIPVNTNKSTLKFSGMIALMAAIRSVMIDNVECWRLRPKMDENGCKLAGRIVPLLQGRAESIAVNQDDPSLKLGAVYKLTVVNDSINENRIIYANEFTNAPFICDGQIAIVDPGTTVTIVLEAHKGSTYGGPVSFPYVTNCARVSMNSGLKHPVHGGLSVFKYTPEKAQREITWVNQGWQGKKLLSKALDIIERAMKSTVDGTGFSISVEDDSGIHKFIIKARDDRTASLLENYVQLVAPDIELVNVDMDNPVRPVLRMSEKLELDDALDILKKAALSCLEDLQAIRDCL